MSKIYFQTIKQRKFQFNVIKNQPKEENLGIEFIDQGPIENNNNNNYGNNNNNNGGNNGGEENNIINENVSASSVIFLKKSKRFKTRDSECMRERP